MDKERLKELQTLVWADYECLTETGNHGGYHADLLAMIDAEMARQSVTDDAVQIAAMELREFIEYAEKYGVSSYNANYMVDCLEQAALRQYQKPKLCTLCNDEIDYEDVDLCSACIHTLELYQYQKPTDEKIRRAIEWQESSKEVAQIEWDLSGEEEKSEPGASNLYQEQMAAFDLAIQALRQMP